MRIILKKEYFLEIDRGFEMLKNPSIPFNDGCGCILSALKKLYPNLEFTIHSISPQDRNTPLFVMSVFPDITVTDKIIESILSGSDEHTVSDLWSKTLKWNIEIDQRILYDEIVSLEPKELTAIFMHEIGHIVSSNSIPMRVTNIMKYQIAKSDVTNRSVMKAKVFRKLLSLPILNACVYDTTKSDDLIRREIQADNYVKKVGYSQYLASGLKKLMNCNKYPKNNDLNSGIANTAQFSLDTMNLFAKRYDNIVSNRFRAMRENCTSDYIKSVIFLQEHEMFGENPKSLNCQKYTESVHEKVEQLLYTESVMTEMFNIGKKLKRIDPNEIDYIMVKTEEIKTPNDKLMLLTYLNSKMDIVDYYIEILNNPELSKRYVVPYTMNQLMALKNKLEGFRSKIISFKIPEREKGMTVIWDY